MTEAAWLAATDPRPMLEYLRGRVSGRKLRLFSAAGFQRFAQQLTDPLQQRGIEALEEMAEGRIVPPDWRRVAAGVRRAIPHHEPLSSSRRYLGTMLYREFCSSQVAGHAVESAAGAVDVAGERLAQTRLFRCLFGNPFRPVTLDLAWLTPTAVAVGSGIYRDRAFDRLPILADALEEAGCDTADVLAHLRGPDPHVRGCWVLDLVLGKA